MLKKLFFAIAAIFTVSFLAYADEQITITTYYPSPYGSYKALSAQKMGVGVTYSNSTNMSALSDSNLIVEGKVGIGTTTPNNLLQVYNLIYFDNTNSSTFLGYQSGIQNADTYNTAVGYQAFYSNTGGTSNSAMGAATLYTNNGGNYNSAMGAWALYSNTVGSSNSAMGTQALYSNLGGSLNSAVGYYSLYSNLGGSGNSAIGYQALGTNTAGNYNSAMGYRAGNYISDGSTANQISSNSVYLGYNTMAWANGDTNEIVIGANAIGAGSNSVVLGNSSITKTRLQGNVTVAGDVNITGISATSKVVCVKANGNLGYCSGSFINATGACTCN